MNSPAQPSADCAHLPDLSAADAALVSRYLTHVAVEKRLAERTLVLYTADLAKLASHALAGELGLTDVQPHHVRRWVAQMHSAGRSARGIALVLSGWRGFYGWLCRQGLMAHHPLQGVRAPKAPKPLPKALAVDQAMQLANHQPASPHPAQAARDRCLVELLYGCGLRLGELLGLDVDARPPAKGWVDAQAAEVHVLGKGGKRRTVPVGVPALQALTQWLGLREQWLVPGDGPDGGVWADGRRALFISSRGRRLSPQAARLALRALSLQAGLATPVHPHMLRHSFASHVLQSSGDLRAVQELLGHANISTTQVYTRLDFQHLAKAYDAAHPRAQRVMRPNVRPQDTAAGEGIPFASEAPDRGDKA